MKDWKIQQEIYHRLNSDFDDDLTKHNTTISHTIVEDAIDYFVRGHLGWVYPAKSYVVAICYAKWIAEIFDEDFYKLLNDENLLYGNDPYFVTYDNDKKTYDSILSIIGDFDDSKGIVPDIRKYFEMEILGHDRSAS